MTKPKSIQDAAREFKSGMQDIVDKAEGFSSISISVDGGKNYIPIAEKQPDSPIKTNLMSTKKEPTREINKLKYDRKAGKMTIEYAMIQTEGADDIKITLNSFDEPLPELVEDMDKLIPHVETICELPEGYCKKAEIRGVSFSHTNDIMGAVITALIPLDSANSPVVINTPHLPEEPYSEGEAPTLPRECVNILKDLMDDAERYIQGERKPEAQTKLNLEDNEWNITLNSLI